MDAVEVVLPSGFAADGQWLQTAWLRPVCGRDEAFLLGEAYALPPAQRTTALLARCLTALGQGVVAVTPHAVRALTVGDREALLLHLRRLTLGDRLICVLACPEPACGELMDLDLTVGGLLLPPYSHQGTTHETVLAGARPDERYRVRFRLPTGADQEAVVDLAVRDVAAATDLLLRRCLEQVATEDGCPMPREPLPPVVARTLPDMMAALDPQAEIVLDLACPTCGTAFCAPFDAGEYFARELRGQADTLYREVHLLAYHYHWSEAELMTMHPQARRRYAGLLAEALEARRSA